MSAETAFAAGDGSTTSPADTVSSVAPATRNATRNEERDIATPPLDGRPSAPARFPDPARPPQQGRMRRFFQYVPSRRKTEGPERTPAIRLLLHHHANVAVALEEREPRD